MKPDLDLKSNLQANQNTHFYIKRASCTFFSFFLCLPCSLCYIIFVFFVEAAAKETASRSHAHGAIIATLAAARFTHNVMNIGGARRALKCSGGAEYMHVLPCDYRTVAMEATLCSVLCGFKIQGSGFRV